jgi:hypothetical protein
MKYVWRIQQAQMMIAILFWSLTLTGVFYPYIRERLLNSWIGPERVALGLALLFICVLGSVILFGIIYDRLKFWNEQQMVAVERNPYMSWKLSPLWLEFCDLWLEIAKSVDRPSPEMREKIRFMEAWIRRCEEIDPWVKSMRGQIRGFAFQEDDELLSVFKVGKEPGTSSTTEAGGATR